MCRTVVHLPPEAAEPVADNRWISMSLSLALVTQILPRGRLHRQVSAEPAGLPLSYWTGRVHPVGHCKARESRSHRLCPLLRMVRRR